MKNCERDQPCGVAHDQEIFRPATSRFDGDVLQSNHSTGTNPMAYSDSLLFYIADRIQRDGAAEELSDITVGFLSDLLFDAPDTYRDEFDALSYAAQNLVADDVRNQLHTWAIGAQEARDARREACGYA